MLQGFPRDSRGIPEGFFPILGGFSRDSWQDEVNNNSRKRKRKSAQ